MTRTRLVAMVAILGVLGGGGALLLLREEPPTYRNPVLAHDAPDPSVLRGPDGTFYAYTTQSDWPVLEYMPVLRSRDLVRWRHVGDGLPELPPWAISDIWAPHVVEIGSKYIAYFSARRYGSGWFGIGAATADSPVGPFRPEPRPMLEGRKFTTIDPFVLSHDGRNYIYWGSNRAPIRAQELTGDGLSLVGRPRALLYPSEKGYEELIEGAWVLPHGDYIYLMYSGDACCEPDPHYAVMVARSASPLGPFEKYRKNPILEANKSVLGPGHNATAKDDANQDWIIYHGFERGEFSRIRQLFIDRIEWRQGWPVINGGRGPTEQAEAPVTGR